MKTIKIFCLLTCLVYLGCQPDHDVQQTSVNHPNPPEVEPEKPIPKKQVFEELPRAIPESVYTFKPQDLADVADLFSKLNGTWIGARPGSLTDISRKRFDFDGTKRVFSGVCQFEKPGGKFTETILSGKVDIAGGKLLLIVDSSISRADVLQFLEYCGAEYGWKQDQNLYRLVIPVGLREENTVMTFYCYLGDISYINSVFFKRDAK